MKYTYNGFWGSTNTCDVKVYGNVIVFTALEDYHGTSITNVIEHITQEIADKYKINKRKLVCFERYPHWKHYSSVKFKLLFGKLSSPEWEPCKDEYIQEFIKDLTETT